MPDDRDEVELSFRPTPTPEQSRRPPEPLASGQVPAPSGFLRLWFACSNQYARAYKTSDGRSYQGRCPKCGQTIRFGIGADGTSERFFRVSCED
jgi:hypothetical protein